MRSQTLLALTLLVLLSPFVIFEKEAISAEQDSIVLQNLSAKNSGAINQVTIANSNREQLQQQRTLLLAQVTPGIEATSQGNLFINTPNNTYEIFNPISDTVTEVAIRTITENAIAGYGSTSFIGRLNPTTNQFDQVIIVSPNTLESFAVLPGENLTLVPGLAVERRSGSPDPSLAGATIINPTTNPQLVNSNGVVQTRITVITSNGPQRANVRLDDNTPRIEDNQLEFSDRDYNDNPYVPRLQTTVIPIETVVTTTQDIRQVESVTQTSRSVTDVQTSRSEVSPGTGRHALAPIVGETGRMNPDGSPEQRARPTGGELNVGKFIDEDNELIFNAEVIAALYEKAKNPVYAGLNLQVTQPEQRATAFVQVQTPPTSTDSQRNTKAKNTILFARVGVGVINQPDGKVTVREYGETPITETTRTTNTLQITNTSIQRQYTSSLTGQTVVLSSNTEPPTIQVIDSVTESTQEAGSRRVTRREVDKDDRILPALELRGGFAYKDFSVQEPGTIVVSGSGVFQLTPDGDSYGVGGRVGVVFAKLAANLNNTIYFSVDHLDGPDGSDTKVGVYVSLGRGVLARDNEGGISIPDDETARRQAGVPAN